MEVWVRSQDKEYFKQVGCVSYTRIIAYVEFDDDEEKVGQIIHKRGHGIQCDGICLAEYPTKERCLEIIDEIQGILSGCLVFKDNLPEENDANKDIYGIVYKGAYFSKSNHQELSTVVYEMPKD